jgi:hypothetical protein
MVEGIPAFFAASKYGAGLIIVMSLVFGVTTIATYMLLCVYSTAGLQRIRLGVFERYGEVLSGAFIALVGLVFWIWPVLWLLARDLMKFRKAISHALPLTWLSCAIATPTYAHGIAGNRYFPGTLTFDDPAVADELIVPNFDAATYPVGPGDSVHDTTYAFRRGTSGRKDSSNV